MKRILPLLLVVSLLFSLCSCVADPPAPRDVVLSQHTAAQAEYLAGKYEAFSRYATGKAELSRPLPIMLAVSSPAVFAEISEAASFSDSFRVPVKSGEAAVYNLKVGARYYWRPIDEAGVPLGEAESFRTEPIAPRNLFLDGVTNARDLGGWQTADGPIRQGMIYRTAKYNANQSAELLITEEGIRQANEVLGIRTEIDLRTVADNENGGITQSPLGASVRYISFPMEYGGNLLIINKDLFADLFRIFAEEENYPIAFHCSIGADRTGVVAFLLNALLGASEEDLYRDYLFSNFGEIDGMRSASAIRNYFSMISGASGNTIAEQTYSYLLSIGVAAQDLDAFLAIMKTA